MIATPEPNTAALARFVHRLAAGDHADSFEADDAENHLRRSLLGESVGPFLSSLLDAYEDHIVGPLREVEPAFTMTDRSLDFVSRLRSMSPSAQQSFGDLLIWFGAIAVKTGVLAEAGDDSLNPAVADVYGAQLGKFFARNGDEIEVLHSGRSLVRALGEPLYAELLRAFALRDARTVGEL